MGGQCDLVDLAGAQQLVEHVVLGVLAPSGDRRRRGDRPLGQSRHCRPYRRVDRRRTGEGQEFSGRHRILGQRRADPAVVGEVEDQRSCQNPFSPAAVEKRLSRGVIQQEQQQILGDTCHGRRMN